MIGWVTKHLQYTIRDTEIIHVWDPPHLIKGIRNNLITKKLQHHITGRWNATASNFRQNIIHKEVRRASWDDIKYFYCWANSGSTKLLAKITSEHIDPDKDKMKVCNATQVFSNDYGEKMLKYFPAMSDTAETLLFFNDLFDSVNGTSKSKTNHLKSAVSENSTHFAFWEYALCMLSKMCFIEVVNGDGEKRGKKRGKKPSKPMKNINQVIEMERESHRTKVIQNWQASIEGYIAISKKCFSLGMKTVSLRYVNTTFF